MLLSKQSFLCFVAGAGYTNSSSATTLFLSTPAVYFWSINFERKPQKSGHIVAKRFSQSKLWILSGHADDNASTDKGLQQWTKSGNLKSLYLYFVLKHPPPGLHCLWPTVLCQRMAGGGTYTTLHRIPCKAFLFSGPTMLEPTMVCLTSRNKKTLLLMALVGN